MIPNNVMQILGRFVPNIQQFQNVKSPDDFAQQLLNSGMVNQQQINQTKQMWNNQPNVRQMIFKQFKF